VHQSSWRRFWEAKQQAPYAINGNQWLSYDDEESIGIKVKYANDKGLGGGMVWSIETDDFQNDCGKGKYPLLQKIKSGLRMSETDSMEVSEEMISSIDEPECPEGFKYSEKLDSCKNIVGHNKLIQFFEKFMRMSKIQYNEV
jgi:GH18 family chitinase